MLIADLSRPQQVIEAIDDLQMESHRLQHYDRQLLRQKAAQEQYLLKKKLDAQVPVSAYRCLSLAICRIVGFLSSHLPSSPAIVCAETRGMLSA